MGCGCGKNALPDGQTRNAPGHLVKHGWVIAGAGWRRKGDLASEAISMSAAMALEGYEYDEELKLWKLSA